MGFSNEQMQQTKQVTIQPEANAFTLAEEMWEDMWAYAPGAVLGLIGLFIILKFWRKK